MSLSCAWTLLLASILASQRTRSQSVTGFASRWRRGAAVSVDEDCYVIAMALARIR
jgi:hypothetical protein